MKLKFLILFLSTISIFAKAQYYGNGDHPMNKSTENIEILKYWDISTPEDLNIYEAAHKTFSGNKNATYKDLNSNKEFMDLCEKNDVSVLGGPLLGNVSSDGVSIWVRSLMPSKIEVEIMNGKKKFKSKPVYTNFESDLTAIIKLKNLKPSTSYHYKLIINDKIVVTKDNYVFKTLPDEKDNSEVKIAFGSCPHRWGLGNQQLFETISSREPAAMLLLGDIAVQDRENNIAMHRADYLLRDFQPPWRNFVSKIPVYASWDDHDYFNNDLAGIPKGFTNEDKENVREIFLNSWSNPSYGLEEEGKGIFFRTRIGPADIIMTDNRYFRTGEEGSFLGEQQMDWLKEQLLDCKGPFIIISSGTMFSDYVSKGKDSWGANDPEGREEIFNLIEENNISGVLLISGDRHGARGYTIPRKSGFNLYEFGAASLGARAGAASSLGKDENEFYGLVGVFAFGEFTFNTSESTPNVTFRLIKEDGSYIYEKVITLDELTPKRK